MKILFRNEILQTFLFRISRNYFEHFATWLVRMPAIRQVLGSIPGLGTLGVPSLSKSDEDKQSCLWNKICKLLQNFAKKFSWKLTIWRFFPKDKKDFVKISQNFGKIISNTIYMTKFCKISFANQIIQLNYSIIIFQKEYCTNFVKFQSQN